MLQETNTVQSEIIEKQNSKISEFEEKFQSLSQYLNPAILILSQLEDISGLSD